MRIERLDHVNLRTTQLAAMITWYEEVLELHVGKRPDFPFPGAWLYAGDVAVIHLVEIDGKPLVGSEAGLKLEHFAFTARGAAALESRLLARKAAFRRSVNEQTGIAAFNMWDPDGNHIHVDFPIEE